MVSVVVNRVKTFGKDGFKMGRLLKFLNWEAWQRHFNRTKETILGTFSRGGRRKKEIWCEFYERADYVITGLDNWLTTELLFKSNRDVFAYTLCSFFYERKIVWRILELGKGHTSCNIFVWNRGTMQVKISCIMMWYVSEITDQPLNFYLIAIQLFVYHICTSLDCKVPTLYYFFSFE